MNRIGKQEKAMRGKIKQADSKAVAVANNIRAFVSSPCRSRQPLLA